MKKTLTLFISALCVFSFISTNAQIWEDCDTIRTYMIAIRINSESDNEFTNYTLSLENIAQQSNVPIKSLGTSLLDYSNYLDWYNPSDFDGMEDYLLGDDQFLTQELAGIIEDVEENIRPDVLFLEVPVLNPQTTIGVSYRQTRRAFIPFPSTKTQISYLFKTGHQLLHLMGIFGHNDSIPNIMNSVELVVDTLSIEILPQHITSLQENYREALFHDNPNRSCNPNAIQEFYEQDIQIVANAHQLIVKGITNKQQYELVDMLGRRLSYGIMTNEHSLIDIRSLSSGIYILRVGNTTYQFYKPN